MDYKFLENKYSKWYFNIVANARFRVLEGYSEKHHIIPKSLGGQDSDENLVSLTAREHFICHWLLTKMVSLKKHQYQMWNAFSCMLYLENREQHRYKITGQKFEIIKKEGSKIKSWKMRGEKNPMFGKTHSEESRLKISKAHAGKLVSNITKEKLRNNMLGMAKTETHKSSLKKVWEETREQRSGSNHHSYGKKLSVERKEKIRQGVLNMPLYTCEHCAKTTTKGNYKRWHGDKCKLVQGVLKFHA
jgi:hypothetical protein